VNRVRVILHPSAFILGAVLACAGCISKDFLSTNSLSYDHPFTDAGAARVRKEAERDCGYRKQAAVKVGGTCTLKTCTTHFQCMDPADAAKYKE
jgi:hypothetical protein